MWGYIDRNGTMAIYCQFQEAGNFSDGKAEIIYRGCRGTVYRNGYFEYFTFRYH